VTLPLHVKRVDGNFCLSLCQELIETWLEHDLMGWLPTVLAAYTRNIDTWLEQYLMEPSC
jgi:hypothetical protein